MAYKLNFGALLLMAVATTANANTADEAARMYAAVEVGLPTSASWEEIILLRNESVRMKGALSRDLPVDATWPEIRSVASDFGPRELMNPEDQMAYVNAMTALRTEIIERVVSE